MGLISDKLHLFVERAARDYLERDPDRLLRELRENATIVQRELIEVFGKDVRLDYGQVALNFPGSTTSDELTVQHRIGRAPQCILTIPTYNNASWAVGIRVNVRNDFGAAQFIMRGKSDSLIGPGTIPVFWAALG
jgi:hypothetical protein